MSIRNKYLLLRSKRAVLSRFFTTNLPNDIKVVQELCKKFADAELKPVAGVHDREASYPAKQIEQLGDMGFMGIGASAEFGGSSMKTLTLSVIVEELSRGDASVGAIVSIHNCLYANLLNRIANQEQKEKWLREFTTGKKIGAFALSEMEAGSDVANISTTAVNDGDHHYVLNGTKAWVTSAEQAQAAIVFATVDKGRKHKGIAAFLVGLNQPGVEVGRNENKIGIKATSTCNITLNDVRVHSSDVLCQPGDGFKVAMEQLDKARIGIASQALGIAQASLDTAVAYAAGRVAFDSPIIRMSSVKKRLAEMALQIESSRLLVRQAAQKKDENQRSTKYTSMAKWQASTTATFCAHNCIQIMGGMGVLESMNAERYYRDARITEIYGGVTDVQMMIVAEQLQKEYAV